MIAAMTTRTPKSEGAGGHERDPRPDPNTWALPLDRGAACRNMRQPTKIAHFGPKWDNQRLK